MDSKKTLLGAALAASLFGFGTAAHAQYNAIVATAPPPPLHEVVPAPRAGLVWSPGHYQWRGNRYVWIGGHWMEARNGYEYVEPRWVQRRNGEWSLVGGHWERSRHAARGPYGDMDGDGIANRDDDDRDGDGYANWDDDFPGNPNRS